MQGWGGSGAGARCARICAVLRGFGPRRRGSWPDGYPTHRERRIAAPPDSRRASSSPRSGIFPYVKQATWESLSLDQALAWLERPGVELSFSGSRPCDPPWDFAAIDFLRFARTDLRAGSTRCLLNAVGNLKRALHCQTDSVLYAAGLLGVATARHWSFTARLQTLRDMSILAPDVLRRINRIRNEVEHEYANPPARESLSDFADVVELFIGVCEPFARASFDQTEWESTHRRVAHSLCVEWSGEALLVRTFRPNREVARLEPPTAKPDVARYRAAVAAWYRACSRAGHRPQRWN